MSGKETTVGEDFKSTGIAHQTPKIDSKSVIFH